EVFETSEVCPGHPRRLLGATAGSAVRERQSTAETAVAPRRRHLEPCPGEGWFQRGAGRVPPHGRRACALVAAAMQAMGALGSGVQRPGVAVHLRRTLVTARPARPLGRFPDNSPTRANR